MTRCELLLCVMLVFGQYFGSHRVNARQLRLDEGGGNLGLSVLTACVNENGTMELYCSIL